MRAWQCVLAIILSVVTSAASAETVEITYDHGGFLFLYQQRWEKYAAQKVNVRVAGPCMSACTVLLGYIPRKDVCVTPQAAFGFHLATMTFATEQLWKIYPDDIRAWITQHGGLTYKILWMQAPEIYRFVRKCGTDGRAVSAVRLGPT
jgi:hypothetical protein